MPSGTERAFLFALYFDGRREAAIPSSLRSQ